MSCRLTGEVFDVAASAGWYSGVAGALAGFALMGILLPTDHNEENVSSRHLAVADIVLTSAFFGLLIMSFSYAQLSGFNTSGSRAGVAAHHKLLYGAALGLTSLLLVFALHSFLSAYSENRAMFGEANRLIIGVITLAGPVALLAFVFSNTLDLEEYRAAMTPGVDCGPGGLPVGVWINLLIVVAGWVAIVTTWFSRTRHKGRAPRSESDRGPVLISRGVLTFTIVIVCWSLVVVPFLEVQWVVNPIFEHVVLAVTALGCVVLSASPWLED